MNTVTMMLNASLPPLSPEAERVAVRKVKAGDKRAADDLVLRNVRLVAHIAKEFPNAAVPMEDRIQQGVIGLMRGIELYDPSAGAKLSTFATPHIRHAIRRYIQDNATLVRIPVCQQDGRYDLSEAAANFRNMLRFEADNPNSDNDATLYDIVGSDDDRLADVDFRALLDGLSPREVEVLTLRYMAGETLEEVGQRYTNRQGKPLSRERVRQIEAGALDKLRATLAA